MPLLHVCLPSEAVFCIMCHTKDSVHKNWTQNIGTCNDYYSHHPKRVNDDEVYLLRRMRLTTKLYGMLQVRGCPGPVMDFFSFLHLFKHTLCNNFKQAVGPGVLQTFSTCASVKP